MSPLDILNALADFEKILLNQLLAQRFHRLPGLQIDFMTVTLFRRNFEHFERVLKSTWFNVVADDLILGGVFGGLLLLFWLKDDLRVSLIESFGRQAGIGVAVSEVGLRWLQLLVFKLVR